MTNIPKTPELFDLTHTLAAPLLSECEYPYEAIPKIGEFIKSLFPTLDDSYEEIKEGVYVAKDAKIWESVKIDSLRCFFKTIRDGFGDKISSFL